MAKLYFYYCYFFILLNLVRNIHSNVYYPHDEKDEIQSQYQHEYDPSKGKLLFFQFYLLDASRAVKCSSEISYNAIVMYTFFSFSPITLDWKTEFNILLLYLKTDLHIWYFTFISAEPFYFVKYGSSNISSIIPSNNLFCFMSFNNLQYWHF